MLSDDEPETPRPKPKRRSIYETAREQDQIKPLINDEYTQKCQLEIDSMLPALDRLKTYHRELKNRPLSIEVDYSKLNGNQNKFLQKKPNYNNYINIVEDFALSVKNYNKQCLEKVKANTEEKLKVLEALQDKLIYKS